MKATSGRISMRVSRLDIEVRPERWPDLLWPPEYPEKSSTTYRSMKPHDVREQETLTTVLPVEIV